MTVSVRVDQLTEPPRIGRCYDVPCLVPIDRAEVEAAFGTNGSALGNWIVGVRPVLLPLHEDSELGQAIPHYHIDIRFLSNPRLQDFLTSLQSDLGVNDRLLEFASAYISELADQFFRLEWRSLKCFRVMPEFTPALLMPSGFAYLKSFVGQPLDCGKCPHRGFHLASARRSGNVGERVVCPGHGLIADLKADRVVGITSREFRSGTLFWKELSLWSFAFLLSMLPVCESALPEIEQGQRELAQAEARLNTTMHKLFAKLAP